MSLIYDGETLANALNLELLPHEGGRFRRTFTGATTTAILFMLIGDDFSAMHRLVNDEIYFYHSGSPLKMLLIDPNGVVQEVVIGPNVLAGEHPQFHVPGNWWQGSSTDGSWSLVSTVMSPGFEWNDFLLGNREHLITLSDGAAAERITQLTRTNT